MYYYVRKIERTDALMQEEGEDEMIYLPKRKRRFTRAWVFRNLIFEYVFMVVVCV